jgi:thiol-disulfide isomerase/thioredoxin
VPGTAGLILQYFYRTDCPVCQNFTPQVDQLASNYAGKVAVQKIESNGVVPTLVLLNNGVEVGRWVNPGTTAPIIAQINSLLAAG